MLALHNLVGPAAAPRGRPSSNRSGPAAAPSLETPGDLNALELDELAEDLTVMGNLLEESTVTKIKV